MSWLQKTNAFILRQNTNLPYVITPDGVYLCFDNFYTANTEKPINKLDHCISFFADKKKILRQSTNYFKFREFPTLIPFDDIQQLDNTIVEGKLLKTASSIIGSPKSIMVIKDAYLKRTSDDEFSELVGLFSKHNNVFLLIKSTLSPQARLVGNETKHIAHSESSPVKWGRTCVAIANHVCERNDRKYCWTHSIPDIDIACYGLNNSDDMEAFQTTLANIGIKHYSVSWET